MEIGSLLDTNRKMASGLFETRLGELAKGAAADVVVYNYRPPTSFEPGNFLGHLLFGLYRSPAHDVVVAGRTRLRQGRPVDIDPAEVAARAQEEAKKLWNRF